MMEFAPFVDVFGWARNDFGCAIDIVTCGFSKTVTATFGIQVSVDKTLDDICVHDYDALAIPGGFENFGFYDEAYDERLLRLIAEFDRQKKCIASVCVGALPIGKSGVLAGRNATTYHLSGGNRQRQLAAFGVHVLSDQRLVQDNNIITSFCPETAADVALRLLRCLAGKETAAAVGTAMGYCLQ